jgi:hypothetical protein
MPAGDVPGAMQSRSDGGAVVDRLVSEVGSWPGIETAPHRVGGTEFLLGDREVGHVHRAGLLDVNFTRRLRDALVAAGRAERHRVVPDSGWISHPLRADADLEGARRLVRLSYLYTALVLGRRGSVDSPVDPATTRSELDQLATEPEVRAAFDRLLA